MSKKFPGARGRSPHKRKLALKGAGKTRVFPSRGKKKDVRGKKSKVVLEIKFFGVQRKRLEARV